MIRLCYLCVLVAIILTSVPTRSSVYMCADIIPKLHFLEVHTNFTAFCILNMSCLEELKFKVDSSDLYWEIHTERIPERKYSVINDTVSSVTFEPTPGMGSQLSCNTNLHGQIKTTLHAIFFDGIGYPPEKPNNLSCICYNGESLTCSWDPGRNTLIPTKYTLRQFWKGLDKASSHDLMQNQLNSYPASRAKERNFSKSEYSKTERPRSLKSELEGCTAQGVNNSCTIYYPKFQLYIDTTFYVEAENDLGRAQSDLIKLDIRKIVMPQPPEILSVKSAVELQRALKIEWKNPMKDLINMKYNLRYRIADHTEWNEVPEDDISSHRTSYTLQSLEPYTVYAVILRCKPQDNVGYWSTWSKEYVATTPESMPSRGPEFWRKIISTDAEGNRLVWMMWKQDSRYANGIILRYNLTIRRSTNAVKTLSIKDTSYNITLSKDSYEVSITASNSYGTSPASTMIIPPATNAVTQVAEIGVKAFPKDGKIWVEWSSPKKPVIGYVIEWCSNTENLNCNFDWQREQSTELGAFLRGDLKPFTYYLIKVYPLYKDGFDRPRFVGAYLQQKAPEVGPSVDSKAVEKTRAVLKWEPLSLEKRNGFITNYTLKYTADNKQRSIIINSTQTEYTLTDLRGKTMYKVTLTANTEKGGMEGPPFTFVTHELDAGEVEAIVVCTCLGFLLLMLLFGLLFYKKRDLIKKHIWPNVPDPSKSNIAQWSPQTPSRHEAKNHPFQDGSFTDVSVVEITADEKSYSEQDSKAVDVMKKNTSEGLSSGIGGSSCMSSQQLSLTDGEEVESAQNTSSNVQYSTVIISGYRGQQPTAVPPIFSRSESTQPLLDCEERPDELQDSPTLVPNQYFKQNCSPEDGGRLQSSQQERSGHIEEQLVKNHQLAGLSGEEDPQDCNDGQNIDFEDHPTISQSDILNEEIKSYVPQTVRQGGYLPQ